MNEPAPPSTSGYLVEDYSQLRAASACEATGGGVGFQGCVHPPLGVQAGGVVSVALVLVVLGALSSRRARAAGGVTE